MIRFAGSALVVMAALSVTACVSILPDPAPADVIYRLQSSAETVSPAPDAKVFRIDRPTAPVSLIRDDIVVSPGGGTLAIAGSAKWAQSIPELIQHSFMDELATRSDLIGVLPTSGARTTHRVHLTVRNFEAAFDQGEGQSPLSTVHYTATVSDASTRDLLGTFTVRETERAASNSVPSIVQAQSAANRKALQRISDWLTTLELKT